MKINSGVTQTLVGKEDLRVATPPLAHDMPDRARASRPSRVLSMTLPAIAASAALIGCSSLTSTPWRVEPAYRVETSHPQPAQGYLALARQYEGEQRNAQALEAYRNAAKAAPADADVQNALGLALARHGQFAPAVVALRRAVALAPERAQLLNNLGYALLLDGRAEDARAMLRLTLAVNPTHETAVRNLAHIDHKLLAVADKSAPQLVAAVETAILPSAARPADAAMTAAVAAVPLQAEPIAPALTRAGTAPESQVAPFAVDEGADMPGVVTRARLHGVSIEIVNGNGISGTAARLRLWLDERGIKADRLANLLPYRSPHTLVLYRPGKADEAHELAARMPVDTAVAPAPAGSTRTDLRVVIGHDARYSAGCASLATCATPELLASSLDWPRHAPRNDGEPRR